MAETQNVNNPANTPNPATVTTVQAGNVAPTAAPNGQPAPAPAPAMDNTQAIVQETLRQQAEAQKAKEAAIAQGYQPVEMQNGQMKLPEVTAQKIGQQTTPVPPGLQVDSPPSVTVVKEKVKPLAIVVGLIAAAITAVLTFNIRSKRQKVKEAGKLNIDFKEALDSKGDLKYFAANLQKKHDGLDMSKAVNNTLQGMVDLQKRLPITAEGREAIFQFMKFSGKKGGPYQWLQNTYNNLVFDNIDYVDPYGVKKDHGALKVLFRTVMAGASATVGGLGGKSEPTAERDTFLRRAASGLRTIAWEGGNAKRRRLAEGVKIAHEGYAEIRGNLKKDTLEAIAKTDAVSISNRQRNGNIAMSLGLAGGVGLVATYAADRFIKYFEKSEKNQEKAETYAGKLELDRQLAMVQPATQVKLS